MFIRKVSTLLRARMLAALLPLVPAACDVLTAPPVSDWPGPHARYPLPDDGPHRTE
ncbi:hypothetical protein [Burkholderia territorii]|nr:hypothetical protein [Burkholderia territorii]